jgi:hypothetical protein
MTTINVGTAQRTCDGVTRRETLAAGALTLLGGFLNQSNLLALEQSRPAAGFPGRYQRARAKSVVLIYLQGGPPTQDMFDLKPDAPSGIRSEFRPIATSAPGISVCEILPNTARWMHKTAVVRSVYHNGGCHKNMPMYTGYDINLPDEEFRETDPPSMGSVCAFLDDQPGSPTRKRGIPSLTRRASTPDQLPPYVYLPCGLGWGEGRKKGGPHGGFLGRRYDPFSTECSAYVDSPPDEIWRPQIVRGEPRLGDADLRPEITLDRLGDRRRLLVQLEDRLRTMEASRSPANYDRSQRLAFDMLTSRAVRSAFDLQSEPDRVRDHYGRTLFGSSTLLARRLVEAGVRFVNVSWDNFSRRFQVSQAAWDTHERNFPMLRETLLPGLDQTYPAFLADLDQRGLLDETLVVMMGEMGRTPRVNPSGGRDHWTNCYSVVFAGAGIAGGTVHGASDRQAAYIKDKPVHIRDIVATIYHCLGINPALAVYDQAGRPISIAHGGEPIAEILA